VPGCWAVNEGFATRTIYESEHFLILAVEKIKLSYTKEFNSLNPYYFEELMGKYFILEPYNKDDISPNILLGLDETARDLKGGIEKIKNSLDGCQSIIIDNLQECLLPASLELLKPYKDKILMLTMGEHNHPWLNTISVPDWMWYQESPMYLSRNYHLYQPALSDSPKLFFMPIRRRKLGRELCYQRLKDLLDHNAIYSYVERGITLPGIPEENKDDQRWFNPDWYNNTLFSIINEDSNDTFPKLYSEKTCKALAFYHPFILVAQQGVLKLIKQAGFETFPELFDETYDLLPNLYDRMNLIEKQIRTFDRSSARSPAVIERLQHNYYRFFDQKLIHQRIEKEVIFPILDFVS